jgi:peptidoglycan/xylan/chitin deacetylase (PgdA/CDA1 family)
MGTGGGTAGRTGAWKHAPALMAAAVLALGTGGYIALAHPWSRADSAEIQASQQADDDAASGPLVAMSQAVAKAEALAVAVAQGRRGPSPDHSEQVSPPTAAETDTPEPVDDPADTQTQPPPPAPPPPPEADPPAGGGVDCSVAKCIALTFDDGPDKRTDKILDVLADKGVKATFFVQGYRVEMFEDQIRRVAGEGHEIGNHTWNHKNLTTLSARAIRLQIKKTNQAVAAVTGITPALVRPPYGAINAKVKREVGLPLVMWSVDTRDWESKNAKKIVKHIKKDSRPGAIVIMHDTAKATGKALGRGIDLLRENGYEFVTVSELLPGPLEPGSVHYQR